MRSIILAVVVALVGSWTCGPSFADVGTKRSTIATPAEFLELDQSKFAIGPVPPKPGGNITGNKGKLGEKGPPTPSERDFSFKGRHANPTLLDRYLESLAQLPPPVQAAAASLFRSPDAKRQIDAATAFYVAECMCDVSPEKLRAPAFVRQMEHLARRMATATADVPQDHSAPELRTRDLLMLDSVKRVVQDAAYNVPQNEALPILRFLTSPVVSEQRIGLTLLARNTDQRVASDVALWPDSWIELTAKGLDLRLTKLKAVASSNELERLNSVEGERGKLEAHAGQGGEADGASSHVSATDKQAGQSFAEQPSKLIYPAYPSLDSNSGPGGGSGPGSGYGSWGAGDSDAGPGTPSPLSGRPIDDLSRKRSLAEPVSLLLQSRDCAQALLRRKKTNVVALRKFSAVLTGSPSRDEFYAHDDSDANRHAIGFLEFKAAENSTVVVYRGCRAGTLVARTSGAPVFATFTRGSAVSCGGDGDVAMALPINRAQMPSTLCLLIISGDRVRRYKMLEEPPAKRAVAR